MPWASGITERTTTGMSSGRESHKEPRSWRRPAPAGMARFSGAEASTALRRAVTSSAPSSCGPARVQRGVRDAHRVPERPPLQRGDRLAARQRETTPVRLHGVAGQMRGGQDVSIGTHRAVVRRRLRKEDVDRRPELSGVGAAPQRVLFHGPHPADEHEQSATRQRVDHPTVDHVERRRRLRDADDEELTRLGQFGQRFDPPDAEAGKHLGRHKRVARSNLALERNQEFGDGTADDAEAGEPDPPAGEIAEDEARQILPSVGPAAAANVRDGIRDIAEEIERHRQGELRHGQTHAARGIDERHPAPERVVHVEPRRKAMIECSRDDPQRPRPVPSLDREHGQPLTPPWRDHERIRAAEMPVQRGLAFRFAREREQIEPVNGSGAFEQTQSFADEPAVQRSGGHDEASHERGTPVDWRATTWGSRTTRRRASPFPLSWATSSSTATSPMRRTGCATVVSGGLVSAASGMSSKPTTEMSSGTRRPAFSAAWIAPSAITSLLATTAVG